MVPTHNTGNAGAERYDKSRLSGVQFYAFLCEQFLGRRPARVQLLHLREPLSITSVPTDQSIRGLTQRTEAVWSAVERACERDDFRPRPSPLCDFCAFREWCPAWGGDPAAAPKPDAMAPALA
jgi:putative RecB family exonuclease